MAKTATRKRIVSNGEVVTTTPTNRIKSDKIVTTQGITIPRPQLQVLEVKIIGRAPLVTHAWDQKAKEMMLNKQQKKARAPREEKDPVACFKAAMYRFPDGGHGVPATGFKAAMVDACRLCDGITMTLAKLLFWIESDGRSVAEGKDLVRILRPASVPKGVEWPRMREDTPRNDNGNPDLRYRPEYNPWEAVVRVGFNAGKISGEQVYNLLMLAGIHCGICEMRPSSPESKTGSYGLWECH